MTNIMTYVDQKINSVIKLLKDFEQKYSGIITQLYLSIKGNLIYVSTAVSSNNNVTAINNISLNMLEVGNLVICQDTCDIYIYTSVVTDTIVISNITLTGWVKLNVKNLNNISNSIIRYTHSQLLSISFTLSVTTGLSGTTTRYIISNGSTINYLAIQLPTNPADGVFLEIAFLNQITHLSVNNGNLFPFVSGNTVTQNSFGRWMYSLSDNTWISMS